MNQLLANIMEQHTPKTNKKIMDGVNDIILKYAPEYLNKIIMSGISAMSEGIPLTYNGWRKLTPKEEFNKVYGGRDNRVNYDISVSSLYTVEYSFTYNGVVINKHLYLPYAVKGNIMQISNTPYNIISVLSDTVISPTYKNIFVRLLRAKLIFERVDRNFIVDGIRTPGQIIHSDIYKTVGRNIEDNLGQVVPPVNLYILGMKGVRESYEKYAGIKDVIFTLDDVEKYRDTHRVYESTKLRPRVLKDTYYTPHDLKIAIPYDSINASNKDFVDNFTFSIMYCFDIFPEAVYDIITLLDTHNVTDEKMFWRIILGRIVFKNSYSINKVLDDMNDHFITLRSYIDVLIKGKLNESGMEVDDFYDLLAIILSNYNMWLMNSKMYNSDLNNRYLDILYYLMYDIIIGINKTLFDINRKSSKKELSNLEINKYFSDNFSAKKFFSVLSGGMNIALEVASSSASSELKYMFTNKLSDQSKGNGVKISKQNTLPEAMKSIKAQDIYFGSVLFLTKSAISPRFKANMFMDFNINTGRIIIPKERQKELDKLDILLKAKTGQHEVPESLVNESEDSIDA